MGWLVFLRVFEGPGRVWAGSRSKVLVTGFDAKQLNLNTKRLLMLVVDFRRMWGWEKGRWGERITMGGRGGGIGDWGEVLQEERVARGKEIHLKRGLSSVLEKVSPLLLARRDRQNQSCSHGQGWATLLAPTGCCCCSLWRQLAWEEVQSQGSWGWAGATLTTRLDSTFQSCIQFYFTCLVCCG